MSMLGVLATALMLLAMFLIPLGFPGLWIMIGIVAIGTVLGQVGWGVLLPLVVLGAAAELVEFLIVQRMSLRYGGTTRAFWGAVIGGTVGVFVGVPVPVLGPVIAGIVFSFIGAGLVTLWESRDLVAAGRVGWGVVLARLMATVLKVGAAIVVLVVGGAAWIVR